MLLKPQLLSKLDGYMKATLMCLEPQRITEHDGHVWANPRSTYSYNLNSRDGM